MTTYTIVTHNGNIRYVESIITKYFEITQKSKANIQVVKGEKNEYLYVKVAQDKIKELEEFLTQHREIETYYKKPPDEIPD